jgi:hypothetical protein
MSVLTRRWERLKSSWKKASVGVRSAIVGGLFVLAAASITILLPLIVRHLENRPNLVIQAISPVVVDSTSGISIVLANNSGVTESVSRGELEFRQSGGPIATAGWRTYQLTGEVNPEGRIKGKAKTADALPEHVVSFPVQGSIRMYDTGGWELRIAFNLNEELPPKSHLSLAVLLPESMEVTGEGGLSGALADPYMKNYVSGDSKKYFQLTQFLRERGKTALSAEITYGSAHTTTYKGSINLG